MEIVKECKYQVFANFIIGHEMMPLHGVNMRLSHNKSNKWNIVVVFFVLLFCRGAISFVTRWYLFQNKLFVIKAQFLVFQNPCALSRGRQLSLWRT